LRILTRTRHNHSSQTFRERIHLAALANSSYTNKETTKRTLFIVAPEESNDWCIPSHSFTNLLYVQFFI